MVSLNTVCFQHFHSQLIRPPFPQGSRLNKIHPRGNPAIVRSIPAVFPQHSYPHPRETRGFRGIPAVPIPVHTSDLNARKVTDTNQQVHSKSATNSQQIEVVESGPISAHYATRMSFVHIYFSITLGDLLEKQLNLLPQMMWNVSPC